MGQRKANQLNKISSFFKNDWLRTLAIFITGSIYDIGIILIPFFQGLLIDWVLASKPFLDILYLTLGFIGTMLILMICRFIKKNETRQFSNKATYEMRKKIFSSFLDMPLKKLQEKDIGDSLAKSLGDVNNVSEGMRKVVTEVFDTGFQITAYAGYLIFLNWEMGLLSLIPLPFALALFLLLKKRIFILSALQRKKASNLSSLAFDFSNNAMTYRMFGRDEDNSIRFNSALNDYKKVTKKVGFLTSAVSPAYMVIALLGLLPIVIMGSGQIYAGNLSIGLFSSMITTYVLICSGLTIVSKVVAAVEKGRASWVRIKPLLSDGSDVCEGEQLIGNSLSFHDFGLSFDNKILISKLNFTASKGQIIGITGKVASGKTALGLSLLKEKPHSGAIEIDGKNLSKLSIKDIDKTIVYMGHESELFSDTIEENISLGDSIDVKTILSDVCMDKDLESVPLKEKTLIGNKGVRLSGGQQERLALARTLAHIKPIVILDDPFASVDPETEKKVFENIKPHFKNSIVLFISHRLTSFAFLDQIIFLTGNGEEVVGTPSEVYAKSKEYATLYDLQKKGEEK